MRGLGYVNAPPRRAKAAQKLGGAPQRRTKLARSGRPTHGTSTIIDLDLESWVGGMVFQVTLACLQRRAAAWGEGRVATLFASTLL